MAPTLPLLLKKAQEDSSSSSSSSPSSSPTPTPSMDVRLRQQRLASIRYTMEEVAKHCKEHDLWIVVQGKVYDISAWVPHHPGGKLPLIELAGKDVTDPFLGFHPPAITQHKLPYFQIGVVADYREDPIQTDLQHIRLQMEQEGLFETRFSFYVRLLFFHFMLLVSAVYLVYYGNVWCSGSWWPYMCSAALLGLFWQQIAFHGHDLGHNAVFHDVMKDWIGGVILTVFFGVSGQWWRRNHNQHHLLTNSVEHDPDIQHMPFLAISDAIFKFGAFWSQYYEKLVRFDAWARVFVPWQHVLYGLIMAVARINLHVQSIALLINPNHKVPARPVELMAMTAYFAWFGALLYALPSWQVRIAFLFVSHAIAGIMHAQITLSHFGAPVYRGRGYNADDGGHFLRIQLATTVDVECSQWMDWFHGGLQFQVEHHVFPRVSRHNLRYVKEKYMKPLALKHNLPYQSCTFLELIIRVLRVLRTVAYEAEAEPIYNGDSNKKIAVDDDDGDSDGDQPGRPLRLHHHLHNHHSLSDAMKQLLNAHG